MADLHYVEVTKDRRVLVEERPSKYYPGEMVERRTVEVKCCGRWLSCNHFTNTCSCGADYNGSGDRLAPREQWGEETGEHLADILRIP